MLKKAFQAWTFRCLVIAMALLYGFSSGAFAQSVSADLLAIATKPAAVVTRSNLSAELLAMSAARTGSSLVMTSHGLVIGRLLPLSMECDKRIADGSTHFIEYIAPSQYACFRRDYRRIDTAFGQGEELVAFVLPHPAGAPTPAAMHVLLVDGKVAQFEVPDALVLNGR